jgi:hypothetical protein
MQADGRSCFVQLGDCSETSAREESASNPAPACEQSTAVHQKCFGCTGNVYRNTSKRLRNNLDIEKIQKQKAVLVFKQFEEHTKFFPSQKKTSIRFKALVPVAFKFTLFQIALSSAAASSQASVCKPRRIGCLSARWRLNIDCTN